MNPYTFLPLASFLLAGFLCAFVYARGLKTDLQKALFNLISCVTIWSFGDFIIWNSASYPVELVMLLYKLQMPSYFFLGSLLFAFVYKMLKKDEGLFYKVMMALPFIATLIGWASPYITTGFRETYWGVIHEPGFLFIPLTLIASALPAEIAIIIILLNLKTSHNKAERKQRILVALASGVVLHVGVATNMVIPHWLGYKDFIQLGSCTVTLFALFLFISVSKYDMIPISVESVIDELFEGSKQGVIMVDERSLIVQMNDAAKEQLSPILKHNPVDSHMRIEDILPRYGLEEGRSELPLDLSEEKGSPCYLHVCRDRYMSKGRANGWVYTIQDITRQKLADMEIRELNSSLEMRVQERTDALENMNAKLLLQTEELEEVGRYKSQFMANLSHEIRTPMNAVMGFTDLLLLEDELKYESKKYLKNIKENSLSLLDLLNDLLDFSKNESGKVQYEEIPVNIGNLVYESCDLVKARLENKADDVYLFVDTADFKYELFSDPIRLKQVLVNLLSNALKFTATGHVIVKVEMLEECELFQKLKFSVIDTGVGIAESEQERIFKAFIQADGTTTRKYGGTGLGLTISSQILEGMDSRIKLQSSPGQGSDFNFELKFRKALAVNEDYNQSRPKVLLYLESGKQYVEQSLERAGCSLVVVKTSEAVREYLAHFDWFICEASLFKKHCRLWEEMILQHSIKLAVVDANLRLRFKSVLPANRFFRLTHPLSPAAFNNLFAYGDEANRDTHMAPIPAMRILMAEDNMYNQSFQRTILEKMGHTVIMTDNGKEALKVLESESFNVVFLDVHMPEMNGIQTAKVIRDKFGKLPMIGITANVTDRVRQDCFDAGMNWFLEKPLEIASLESTLRKVISS